MKMTMKPKQHPPPSSPEGLLMHNKQQHNIAFADTFVNTNTQIEPQMDLNGEVLWHPPGDDDACDWANFVQGEDDDTFAADLLDVCSGIEGNINVNNGFTGEDARGGAYHHAGYRPPTLRMVELNPQAKQQEPCQLAELDVPPSMDWPLGWDRGLQAPLYPITDSSPRRDPSSLLTTAHSCSNYAPVTPHVPQRTTMTNHHPAPRLWDSPAPAMSLTSSLTCEEVFSSLARGIRSNSSLLNNNRNMFYRPSQEFSSHQPPHTPSTTHHFHTHTMTTAVNSTPTTTISGPSATTTRPALLETCAHIPPSHLGTRITNPNLGSEYVPAYAPYHLVDVPALHLSPPPPAPPSTVDARPSSLSMMLSSTMPAVASPYSKQDPGSRLGQEPRSPHAQNTAAKTDTEPTTPPPAQGCVLKRTGSKWMRCRNCGTRNTPQWRCGPAGPRTLCNACGVRFKKGLPLEDRMFSRKGGAARKLAIAAAVAAQGVSCPAEDSLVDAVVDEHTAANNECNE